MPERGPHANAVASEQSRVTEIHRALASVVGGLWKRAQTLNVATLCLALAAQQMLCTAPLLVAFSVIAKRTTGSGIGSALASYLGLSPAASTDVVRLFEGSNSISNLDTFVGLGLGLLFAMGVAATQQRGFELIWSQPRVGLRSTYRQAMWVVGLCLYMFIVFYAGNIGHRLGDRATVARPAGPLVQLGVSFLFFWWSQHFLLTGCVAWLRLLPSSVGMAAGMTGLVALSGPVMSAQIVSQVHDYGLLGATFVLSIWLVALSSVIFGSAFLGAYFHDLRASRPRRSDA